MEKILRLNKSELIDIIVYTIDAAMEHGDDNFNNSRINTVHLITKLNDVEVIGDENNTPSINFEIDNTK